MNESEGEKNVNAENKIPEVEAKSENFWLETLRFIVVAALIVFPIRYFIAEPFIVSGSSMDPTFENGQYLIVDEISYRFEPPARGDVVIFKYPLDPKKYYIKRIVGLPNETLTMHDTSLTIKTATGESITWSEPYVKNSIAQEFTATLNEGEYFVMGDNRPASSDSRIWGPLERRYIVGKPVVRLLPVTKINLFPGEETVTQ